MRTPADPDLASIGRSLVERLGGQWTGRGGLCRCPAHDDRNPSLSIRVGTQALLYHCFAGCTVMDVINAVRRLDRRALQTVSGEIQMPPAATSDSLRPRLHALWTAAVPLAGSPASIFLNGRHLKPDCDGLRFHPRVPLGSGSNLSFRPAMLAAVQDGPELLALHRTFLTADGSGLAPDLAPPRRMLGRPGSGAVRLARPSAILGIAEGIETALAAMILLGVPVWAALGNERLPHLSIPLGVRRLLILADDDVAGRRAAALAAERHGASVRQVCRLWPGRGFNDWNDRLRSGGKGVGERVRQAV